MQPYPGRAQRIVRLGSAAAAPSNAPNPGAPAYTYGAHGFHAAQAPVAPAEVPGPSEQGSRLRQNAAASMNHMESSVTRLLFATKMLLESLTQWCRGTRSETDVSDVYVRLGNDFKVAITAFSSYGIDMSDLYSVPPDLRVCLEDCLSEPASPAVLDRHLPRIREIIIRMLEGLKRKQQAYKDLMSVPPQAPQPAPPAPRRLSEQRRMEATPERPAATAPVFETPVRGGSREEAAAALERGGGAAPPDDTANADLRALRSRDALERRASKRFSAYTINKMGLGGTVLGTPLSGGTGSRTSLTERTGRSPATAGRYTANAGDVSLSAVPRPLSGVDAWAQRNDPEASWVSEPAAALSTDGAGEVSVGRAVDGQGAPDAGAIPAAVPESAETTIVENDPNVRTPKEPDWDRVAAALPAGDNAVPRTNAPEPNKGEASSLPEAAAVPKPATKEAEPATSAHVVPEQGASAAAPPAPTPAPEPTATPVPPAATATPIPTSLTVFLQLGRHTRKVNLDIDPAVPGRGLTVARLRMLFVDQFAYSPGMDDFPEIYIKDPSSGIQYQLEDLDDVHEKSLLTLNIEPLDQVKQHMDLSLGGVNRDIRELKQMVRDLRERERVVERTREIRPPEQVTVPISDSEFRAAGDRIAGADSPSNGSRAVLARELKSQYQELQRLRRDFAILRQVHDDGESDIREVFASIRGQAREFSQVLALGPTAGRNLIDSGKGKLDTRSQEVLSTVEDLQDLVEDLKLDVSHRGVKPKSTEMRRVAADIASTTRRLEELEQFIQSVKPSWKRTWEAELQNIVDEQEFLNYQEGLLVDLQQDHKALQDVYANIQQVVRLREMQQRSDSRGPRFVPPAPDEEHEGLGTVMMEVRGQSIDHERRLRALQTAERSREKARQGRVDEFADELAGFVDNKGLRKTGGHRETERVRQKRDNATLRAMFSNSSLDTMSSSTPSRSASYASLRTDDGSAKDELSPPPVTESTSPVDAQQPQQSAHVPNISQGQSQAPPAP